MPRLKPASRLYSRLGRWIFNTLEVNNLLRRMTRIPGTLKRISFSRIFLLMRYQARLNLHRHSLRKNKIVVLAKENFDDRTKAKILLLLVLTPLLSGRTRIKIRRTSPTLSATLISRKVIIPISAPRKSQKTSISLDDLHVSD